MSTHPRLSPRLARLVWWQRLGRWDRILLVATTITAVICYTVWIIEPVWWAAPIWTWTVSLYGVVAAGWCIDAWRWARAGSRMFQAFLEAIDAAGGYEHMTPTAREYWLQRLQGRKP